MKRLILFAALLVAALSAQAQTTIDFTGVSINTERVKKVYERKTFVVGTATPEIFPGINDKASNVTAMFGARFGMVWKFGFYVGADIGIGGFPQGSASEDVRWDAILSGMRKDPRVNFVAGGIWRVKNNFNLYLGSGLAIFQTLVEQQNKEWKEYSGGLSPTAELGAIFHVNKLSFMIGAGVVPLFALYPSVRATLGVGYNF